MNRFYIRVDKKTRARDIAFGSLNLTGHHLLPAPLKGFVKLFSLSPFFLLLSVLHIRRNRLFHERRQSGFGGLEFLEEFGAGVIQVSQAKQLIIVRRPEV